MNENRRYDELPKISGESDGLALGRGRVRELTDGFEDADDGLVV